MTENSTKVIILLLVEDDVSLKDLLGMALSEEGFEVVMASNGTKAIAELDANGARFKGLVTDIRLGNGPDGWDLARHARELNGQIAVVYVAGDSVDDWPANGVPKSVVIHKPFAEAQLLTALSTLLTQAG